MKKISFSLLIMIILISLITPVFAFSIIEDNILGNEMGILNDSERMINNYGTIKRNEGSIENNYGVIESMNSGVTNNYGTIKKTEPNGAIGINDGLVEENGYKLNVNRYGTVNVNNYEITANEATGVVHLNNSEILVNTATINQNKGTVKNNFGEILTNYGTVEKNQYDNSITITNVVVNADDGKILENYAKVENGIIEKNYSKDVSNLIINNNYSNEVGENVTIKRNFANFIDNATIENQYYKLTIIGNISLEATIDLDGDLTNNIFVDSDGQTWIRAEDAMYTITPKKGYRITGEDVTASGETIVGWEGPRQLGLTNVSGEIIVEAETEELLDYPIREGNEFKVDRFKDESLTITVGDGNNDDVKKILYKKIDGDEYKQATAGFSTRGLDNGDTEFVFRKQPFFEKLENGKYQFEFISEYGTAIAIIEITGEESSIGGTGDSSSVPSGTQSAPKVETVQEVKLNNPQTGNSIILWCAILIVSIAGVVITRKKQ